MATVQIEVRNVYGVQMVYPVNEEAKKFSELTGKKTFSHADLCVIESLGFNVEQVQTVLAHKFA